MKASKNLINSFNNIVNSINQNKFMITISLILLNIGSKYIDLNLTKGQELLIKSVSREILIFSICFMASHDIIVSFIITFIIIIFLKYLFNENSNLCILPNNFKKLVPLIDSNNDKKLSNNEINKAIEILKKNIYYF